MKKEQIKTIVIILAVVIIVIVIFFVAKSFGLTGKATAGSNPKGDACLTNANCTALRPVCNPTTKICERCASDSQCLENPKVGAATCYNGGCFYCNIDDDCKAGWGCAKIGGAERGICTNNEWDCNDLKDNDRDGKTDYADSECTVNCNPRVGRFKVYPNINGVVNMSIAGCCDTTAKCFNPEVGCVEDFAPWNNSIDNKLFCSVKNNLGVWCYENYANDGRGRCVYDSMYKYNRLYNSWKLSEAASFSTWMIRARIVESTAAKSSQPDSQGGLTYNPDEIICCVTTPPYKNTNWVYPCVGQYKHRSECEAGDYLKVCSAETALGTWGCSKCLAWGLPVWNEVFETYVSDSRAQMSDELAAAWDLYGPEYVPTNKDDLGYEFRQDFCCNYATWPICSEPVCEDEESGESAEKSLAIAKAKKPDCCADGFEKCVTAKGTICCDKRYEECRGVKLPFGLNSQHCEAKDECNEANGKKKCKGDESETCCNKDDTCATVPVYIPAIGEYKNVAICQPKKCSITETPCGTDVNGLKYCCNSPKSECKFIVDPDKPENLVKYCMSNEQDCKNEGKELCSGRIKICCPVGTCQVSPAGQPYCAYL